MDAVALVQRIFGPKGADHSVGLHFLQDDVTLRVWRWDGSIALRGRRRVLDWFREEWQGWPDASLEVFSPPDPQPSAVQFRIQATEDGRYLDHNRALFATLKDGLVHGIDLYCAEPVPGAHRKGYIAPATMSDEGVRAFLEEGWHGFDVREWVPLDWQRYDSRRVAISGSGEAHPGGNFIGGARWTPEEADARIDAILEEHRRKGTGFTWWVMPFDTPGDLPQRLEQRGLMLAGQNERMARLGLDDLSDIPVNEELVIVDLDGEDEAAMDELVRIDATCFHSSQEQADNFRQRLRERLNDAEMRKEGLYTLVYLGSTPVGMAAANFRAGFTYLAGAATLPEYRGRRVYSTLLKHRLAAACERGYHLAAIDAGPMSKRVVAKYGFKEYGTVKVYGWMPQIDPEVIRSLVPDE